MFRKTTKKDYERAGEPIYKVVHEEEKSGRLRSLIVGRDCFYPDGAGALTYKPDRVISDGEYGIWCCDSLEYARNQARENGNYQLCRIHKVSPIGAPITTPEDWDEDGIILYPSIIMGELIETVDRREAKHG